jgi:hypothetical protein
MSESQEMPQIVLPTRKDVTLYGKPRIDPEHDPLSIILARTDTKIGKAITAAVVHAVKKARE